MYVVRVCAGERLLHAKFHELFTYLTPTPIFEQFQRKINEIFSQSPDAELSKLVDSVSSPSVFSELATRVMNKRKQTAAQSRAHSFLQQCVGNRIHVLDEDTNMRTLKVIDITDGAERIIVIRNSLKPLFEQCIEASENFRVCQTGNPGTCMNVSTTMPSCFRF